MREVNHEWKGAPAVSEDMAGVVSLAVNPARSDLAKRRFAHLGQKAFQMAKSISDARHSISGRIKLFAGLATMLLLALGSAISIAFWQIGERSEANSVLAMGALASAELNSSIADARYHSARFAITGEGTEMTAAFTRLDAAKSRLESTAQTAEANDLVELDGVVWLSAQVEGFERELEALRAAVNSGSEAGALILAEAVDVNGQTLADFARDYEQQFVAEAEASNAALREFNDYLSIFTLATIALGMGLSLLGARFFVLHFADAIGAMTRSMVAIADGDESVNIPGQKRTDEIGAMARSLTVFRNKANDIVRLEKEAADTSKRELELRENAARENREKLARLAGHFENEMGGVVSHVASASSQLHDTANAIAKSAGSAAELVTEVARSMDETTDGVTAAASATDQFALSIGEIGRQASRSAEIAVQARERAESADIEIEALRGTSDEASKLVELISSIAQRTNMLALNASIEAARGGASGKGFAVVATEVKELAQQTQTATDEVARQIAAIQTSTTSSVDALKQIDEQIREMEINATAIAQAVDEQSVASRDLAQNLERAAAGANRVSDRFGLVSDVAEATDTAADQLVAAASGLQDQARALDGQAKQFVATVRRS